MILIYYQLLEMLDILFCLFAICLRTLIACWQGVQRLVSPWSQSLKPVVVWGKSKLIPWKPVPACLRLVVSTLGHEKMASLSKKFQKTHTTSKGHLVAHSGITNIKQFSSNARRCFKALYLFGYFLAAPGHPTTIDRDPPTLVFQHQKAQLMDGRGAR